MNQTFRRRVIVAAVFTLAWSTSQAQTLQQVCMGIVTTTTDYVRNDTAAFSATFDYYCKSDGSRSEKTGGLELNAVVESIPVGLKGTSGDTEQKLSTFCRSYASTANTRSSSTMTTQKPIKDAYKSLDTCMQLAAMGGMMRHDIRGKEMMDFFFTAGRGQTLNVKGIDKSSNMTCTLPGGKQMPDKTVALAGNVTLNFSCRRKPTSQNNGTANYEEGTVTVFTDFGASGNYSATMPQDTILGLKEALEIDARLRRIEADVVTKASTATTDALSARFAPLDGVKQMVTTIGCPAGWTKDWQSWMSINPTDRSRNPALYDQIAAHVPPISGWTHIHFDVCRRP